MNKQQTNSDKKILAFLEAEYNKVRRETDCLRLHVTDLNFEENVPDPQERHLMTEQLDAFEGVQKNLMNRILFYRNRVKGAEQSSQACGDAIATQQDRQNEATQKLCNLCFKVRNMVYAPSEKCAKCGGDLLYGLGAKDGDETICFNCANQITNEELQQALDEYRAACTHHCGQDATCQVGDGNAVVEKPIITGESLEQLVGSTVRLFHKPGHKCIDCPYRSKSYGGKCEYKKVELVGGYYLCLAPLPNSIVTE